MKGKNRKNGREEGKDYAWSILLFQERRTVYGDSNNAVVYRTTKPSVFLTTESRRSTELLTVTKRNILRTRSLSRHALFVVILN